MKIPFKRELTTAPFLLGLVAVAAAGASAGEIWVRPGESLIAARDRARAAEKPCSVVLADGVWEVTETIRLDDPRDSSVTWRAAHPGRAVLAGGAVFRGGEMRLVADADVVRRLPMVARGKALAWRVPDALTNRFAKGSLGETVAGGRESREQYEFPSGPLPLRMPVLSVGSRFMMPAAYPNGRDFVYVHATNVVQQGAEPKNRQDPGRRHLVRTSDGRENRWDWEEADIYAWGQVKSYGYSTFRKVLSLDRERSALDFGFTGPVGVNQGGRFRFLNVLEELDAPGEWCYHRPSQSVILYPPEDLVGDTVCVLGWYVGNFLVVQTNDVRLEGLAFTAKPGYEAVVIDNGATNCTVAGCRFSAIDGHAAFLGGRNNAFLSCDFEDITSSALHVRGGRVRTLEHSGNVVENCLMHHLNFLESGMFHAGVRLFGCGHAVRHNVIYDTVEQAIGFHSFATVVEYNRIFDACQDYGDANAIGTGGMSSYGSKVRFNDVAVSPGFNYGIYVDNCAGGVEVAGNVVRDYGHFGILVGGGRDNVISNNVIVGGWGGISMDNRGLFWPGWATAGAPERAYREWTLLFDFEKGPVAKAYPKWASAWRRDGAKNFFAPVDNTWVNNVFLDLTGCSSMFTFGRNRFPPREDVSFGNVCVRTHGREPGVSDIQDGNLANAKTNRLVCWMSTNTTRRAVFKVRMLDGTPENPIDLGFADVPKRAFDTTGYALEPQGWVDVDALVALRAAGAFTNVYHIGDFTLKPGARLLREIPNFQPIPFDKIGLYRDAWRRELPDFDNYVSPISTLAATALPARAEGRGRDARPFAEGTESCLRFAEAEFRKYLPNSGIRLSLKVDAALEGDAFCLREEAEGLVISGGTERGCLFGVYSFLENECGARFYTSWFELPPKDLTCVPKGLNRTEHPAFEGRCCFWHDACKAPFCAKLRLNFNPFGEIPDACGGNSCRFGKGLGSCHTLGGLLPEDPRLCLSKEENYALVRDRVLARIAADPGARFYGVSYPDCRDWCRCPACERTNAEEGSPAGTLVRFVNRLAADAERAFPGVQLETLAYEHTIVPPKTPLATNVIVCLCSNECDFYRPLREGRTAANRKFAKAVEGWGANGPLYLWNYTTDFCGYLMPFPNTRGLLEDIRFFRDNRVKFLFEQGAYQGRHAEFAEWKAYLIAKAMWNPDLDEEALREDFFRGYYGAGASPLLAYLDFLDREHGAFADKTGFELVYGQPDPYPYMDERFIRTARGYWDAAEKATRNDAARNYHVRMGAMTVDYLELRAAMAKRPLDRARVKAAGDVLRVKMDEAGDVALLEYPRQLFGDLQAVLTDGGAREVVGDTASLGDAAWLWSEDKAQYARFKCKFTAGKGPLRVCLPMDSRYTLYLDCRRVARGVGRDGAARTCRTYDFDLMKGEHMLEVLVADIGEGATVDGVPGFALKAEGEYDGALTTGKGPWCVRTFQNVTPLAGGRYRVAGHSPWGDFWNSNRRPVRSLAPASVKTAAAKEALADSTALSVGQVEGADDFNALLSKGTALTLAAGAVREVVWDVGKDAAWYVEALMSGGAGTEIRWAWSSDGKTFGPEDIYISKGSAMFESFELPEARRGRYLRLKIRVAGEPIAIKKMGVAPLGLESAFVRPGDDLAAAIRANRGVTLADGVHFLSETVTIDRPIVIRAEHPGKAIIRGSFDFKASEFVEIDEQDAKKFRPPKFKILKWMVPACLRQRFAGDVARADYPVLLADLVPQFVARGPNDSFFRLKGGQVTHERGRKIVDPSADDHPFVRDSLAELDVPSEWFCEDGILYYSWAARYRWAKAFREKSECQLAHVTAPFFLVKATTQARFEGVAFQAKVGAPPVVLEGAKGVTFDGCAFRGTFGGIAGTADETRIANCSFDELLGTSGVELKGDGNVIESCTAQFGGRALRDSKAVFSVAGIGNRVSGCTVKREPGPAVAFAGRDNLIEQNDISRVAHDVDDPSAIVGEQAAGTVRDNRIDVPSAVQLPERGLVLVPKPRSYKWTDRPLPPEGYRLKVDKSGEVTIEAADAAGRFYAGQTLRQLPKPYPEIEIEDWPEYSWRGVHLDEARHFFGKAAVLRLLDQMAAHKYNVFHWHLTDDQGWRLQLDGFPELIEWGARRPTYFRYRSNWEQDGKAYGPFFYTKEDVKEVLLAAKARHIRVVPEIELPGHCTALLAAHPEFSCRGTLEPRAPWNRLGVSKNVLCVGNDAAIRYYERIFDEVCKVFPDEYIHIGGDECPTDRWKECPKCQARLKAVGGKEIRAIHGWLTHHFSDYLTKKAKKVVGYDELMEGGCPTSTTIMNWRDPRDAAKAARSGNDVVLIWGDRSYFDGAQGVEDDPYWYIWDLGWYADYIYGFRPRRDFEKEVRPKILGSQCMLWTEYMLTPDEIEWKLWPRACAMAEVLWTGDEGREWNEFVTRLVPHVRRLRAQGVNSAPVPDRLLPEISKDLVKDGNRVVGVTLHDGKVLLNANRYGVRDRLFAGATVSNDFAIATRKTVHCALAKVTIPESVEPRLQIDYAWGFGPEATVTVRVRDWTTVEGEIDARDGKLYFTSVFSTYPARWGVFDGAQSFSTYARQIRGRGCVGYFHENYYGQSGETLQVRTGFSRRSVDEAAAFLAREMPTFDAPVTRLIGKKLATDAPLPLRAPVTDNPSAVHIQRTLKKLESSTEENPVTVRILFYGQSVTAQHWSAMLTEELRERYPTVNFIVRNEAIGGYATDSLVRCTNWDAVPFYPDLILFHDYGKVFGGYDAILGAIRRKTTAEIVVWSSHLRRNENLTNIVATAAARAKLPREERLSAPKGRTEEICALAEKSGFMYIDLQRKWCDALVSNGWTQSKLIGDSVHLNRLGFEYYRAFVGDELVCRPELGESTCAGRVSELPFAERLAFVGNRVVAVSDGTGDPDASAEVWLDGKPIAEAATTNMWAMTRPSVLINWFPGLKDCWFDALPQDEFWTLTILPDDPSDKLSTLPQFAKRRRPPMIRPLRFRVDGSKTGFDGEGDSAHAFRSKSGRVNIIPNAFEDYYDCLAPDNPWHQDRPTPGRKIFWRTYPLFAETVASKPKHAETVLVQGCDNGRHVLEFRNVKGRLGIGKLVVHEPPATK